MSRVLGTSEIFYNIPFLENQTADPNAGAGTAKPLGTLWIRNGSYPARPTEIYEKLNSTAKGWVKQNLANLNVYNVTQQPYNVVADGVTDAGPGIIQAYTDAAAAGGGIIYFPATTLGYACYKNPNAGAQAIFEIQNKSNLVFMGDGYASWFKMTGDFGGLTMSLFRNYDRSQRILFYGLRVNGTSITNPSPINQNHAIQVSTDVPDVGPPHDITVMRCWFDPILGAGFRVLGAAGFGQTRVFDCHVYYCAFNMAGATQSRSGIEVQRNTSRMIFKSNWFGPQGHLPTDGQQIDFEPGSGDGPEGFLIAHNIHDVRNPVAITLSGVDITHPSTKCMVRHNIITGTDEGGGIEAVFNPTNMVIKGNIITSAGTTGFGCIELRNPTAVVVAQNILISTNAPSHRAAIRAFADASSTPFRFTVVDNLCAAITDTSVLTGISIDSTNQLICSGNLLFQDNGTNASSVGIQFRSVNIVGQDWICNANLVVATGAQRFTNAINFSTASGNDIHNVCCNDNLCHTATNTIQFDSSAHPFLDWRSCHGNNCPGSTNLVVNLPSTNVGVTVEGTAGPKSQIDIVGVAAGPSGNVTAGIGSLCLNQSGAAGSVLYYKESGTGTSGWISNGGIEISWGAQALTTATAARFLAPGFDLAAEISTEIKWPLPRPGNLRNLRLQCTAGVGGGNNTYTLRKNGVNTAMAIVVANTGSNSSVVTSVAFVAGDLVSLQVTKSVAPGTPQTNVVLTLELAG